MASLTTLTPACVPSAVQQRCNGHEHAGALARPASASGFFAGESRFLSVAQELRSGSKIAMPKAISATTAPLTANPPFSKSGGGGDNSGLKSELLVSFLSSSSILVILVKVFVESLELLSLLVPFWWMI